MAAAEDRIAAVELRFVRASPKTVWTFLDVVTQGGATGVGEATLAGAEAAMAVQLRRVAADLVGRPALRDRETALAALGAARSLAEYALRSALDQALWDLAGQDAGRPLRALLGSPSAGPVALYANVNRRTLDRSPAGFADSARRAAARGFASIKIAPFDAVTPEIAETAAGRTLIGRGVERIAAVRQAIGGGVALMIDCHWRLTPASATAVLRDIAPLGVGWFECPLAEDPGNFAALKRLRHAAAGLGIRLAGAETQSTAEGFRPFLEAGVYDVVMPDVKYAGGYEEMLRIAALAERHGVAVSLHNPSGPIAHAASLQAASLLPGAAPLECQFDESPVFIEILDRPLPETVNGDAPLPAGPGLGVGLDRRRMAAVAILPEGAS